MATPLLSRARCLVCLRRTMQVDSALVTPFLRQMRKKSGRPKDAGTPVRLLEDMKGFGREGAIFRADRGIMRNSWYPTKKAEYMTNGRLKELGLTKNDIGERDPMFGMQIELESELVDDAVEAVAGLSTGAAAQSSPEPPSPTPPSPKPAVEIGHIAPNRALELLTAVIPEVITFERHLKHLAPAKPAGSAPEPADPGDETEQSKAPSPLELRRAKLLEAQKAPEPQKTPEEAEKERRRAGEEAEKLKEIHGPVSVRDVATAIKDKLLVDVEASRIHVQPEDITFLGLAEGLDKLDKVGRVDIEIRTHVGRDKVEPVRKSVEIVAVKHPLQQSSITGWST